MRCSIHIQGHLDPSWQDWFEGLAIVHEDEGTSRLSGSLRDQAALHGILIKIRGLGLTLLALETGEAVPSDRVGEAILTGEKGEDDEPNDEPEARADHDDAAWGCRFLEATNTRLHQGRLASASRANPAHLDSIPGRNPQPGRIRQWRSAYTGRCRVPRSTPADRAPHRERPSVLLPGCLPVRPWHSPSVGRLSPVEPELGAPVGLYLRHRLYPAAVGNYGAHICGWPPDERFRTRERREPRGPPALYTLVGISYILGGLLFGIATLRAGILSRWAAGLLVVGSVLPIAFRVPLVTGLIPPQIQHLAAMPVGIAVAWLGYALVSERRKQASQVSTEGGNQKLRQTGAA